MFIFSGTYFYSYNSYQEGCEKFNNFDLGFSSLCDITTPVALFGITHFELKGFMIGGYNRN